MPLYMDIHIVNSDNFTVEDIVKAHMKDVEIQEKFGVIQKKYWVNEEAKTLFCLMEGPNKEACNKVHKESHGNTACNIIEVFDDEFNLFLGVGKNINDLAYTITGELDTGYRSILLVRLLDLTGKYDYYYLEISQLIDQYQGIPIVQADTDIMASFINAYHATSCVLAISKLLKSNPDNFEFSISVVSGRPVDEKGMKLFEKTKRKGQYIIAIGLKNTICIDTLTKTLSNKAMGYPTIQQDDFKILEHDDFTLLFQLVDLINKELYNPDFKSNNLNKSLGFSKSQSYRKIKSLTGITANQLIQELRLRQSLKRLNQNNHTIAEIAYELGFNSPTYFTRVFRKRYHILPTSFVKLSTH